MSTLRREQLGLTRVAGQLLDDLREFESWAAVADLCANRDGALVLRCLAELRRAGLVEVRRGRRGRRIAVLTESGRRA